MTPRATPHRAFSFTRLGAIASNTLLELFRMKVFYFLLIFALFAIGVSAFTRHITFLGQFQALKDTALGSMSIFTWLLAVLCTAMLLPNDIEDRTLYTILAKPVPRFEYVAGKFLGVVALLAIAVALMSAVFLLVLYLQQQAVLTETVQSTAPEDLDAALREVRAAAFHPSLAAGIVSIFLTATLCAALTLFISTFASSTVFTIMVSVAVYFIGHLQGIARTVWLEDTIPTPLTKIFLALVSLVFPDLQIFSLVDDVAVGTAVPLGLFLKTCGLGVTYAAFYLLAAYFVFAGKEL